jgi:spore coat protein JB
MVNRGNCQNNQGRMRPNPETMVPNQGMMRRNAESMPQNQEMMRRNCDGMPQNQEMTCRNADMTRQNQRMMRTRQEEESNWRQEVPTGNRSQLLSYIDEVSFAAYDTVLYLDTHPDCPHGLHYFQMQNEKRNFALREYARLYGPLNLSDIQMDCDTPSWEWISEPWPWEGRSC